MSESGERFSTGETHHHKDTSDCVKKLADLGLSEATANPDPEGLVCKPKTRKPESTISSDNNPSAGEATLKIVAYMDKLDVFELWTERIFSALDRLLQDIECIEEAVREENLENTSRMYSGLLLAKMYSTVGLLLEQVMGMAKPSENVQIEQSPFCSVFKQDTNGRLMVTLHEAFIHAALAYLKACDRESQGSRDEYMGILNFITMFDSSSSTSTQPGDTLGAPFLSKHSSFFKMVKENAIFFQRFKVSSHYRLALDAAYHMSPRKILHELTTKLRDAIQDALAMERYTCKDHKRLVMVLEKKQWENRLDPEKCSGGMLALFNRYRNTDDAYLVFVYNILQTLDATAERSWTALKGCACGHRFHVRCEPLLYD